jgi:hypothetical protein
MACHYDEYMGKPSGKKTATTVYLEPEISRAIKVKSAVSGRSVSELTNEGLRRLLREDDHHLSIFKQRKGQRVRSYEDVLAELRKDGLI